MKTRDTRFWTDARLVSAGGFGGLALLLFCVSAQLPGDVRAGASKDTATASESSAKLSEMDLLFPVPAVPTSAMANSFDDLRGVRTHHAVDILAPRNSEVVAVADGTIAKMTTSAAGGITLYEFSPDRKYCYYYAHLQAYAHDLVEGEEVKRGHVLGYVGTTGNAPPNTPHLHFAIALVEKKDQWWGGKPLNPYPIWR